MAQRRAARTRRPRPWRVEWLVAVCVVFLAALAVIAVVGPEARAARAVHSGAALAAGLAAVAGGWTWWQARDDGRARAWRLLLGLAALTAVPGIVQIAVVAGSSPRTALAPPPLAAYLTTYGLALASLLSVPTRPVAADSGTPRDTRGGGRRWLTAVLDSVIVVGAFAIGAWSTVLEPALRAGTPHVASLSLILAVNLLVAVAVVLLATFRRPIDGPRPVLLGGGLFALAISTCVGLASQLGDHGSTTPAQLLGFPFGWTLVLLALVVPAAHVQPPVPGRANSVLMWGHAVFPYLPLVAVGAFLAGEALAGTRLGQVEIVAVISLLAITLVRQMITVVDNTTLLSELRESQRDLQYLAFHDPLTGLANRALFLDRASWALERQARGDSPVGLLYCDLDGFKTINDRYGHAAGDALLRHVAERLCIATRACDTVARLGGDEFAVLLDGGGEDLAGLAGLADRVADAIHAPLALGDRFYRPEASFGLVLADSPALSTGSAPPALPGTRTTERVDSLLEQADHAMYDAKRDHRRGMVTHRLVG
ncbi:hypothetical protein ACG83_36065 [Frankia sp. R43]|nr:hypothetical protein ACG83_36065 [Frankia sp. R43]